MIEAALQGLSWYANIANLLAFLGGCALGLTFGILPGLGGVTALTMLIPLTFALPPETTLAAFAGVIGSIMCGGAVTAVLINIPGTAANIATTIEGYPMTQRGEAGRALGIAATASPLGGLVGILVLVALLPAVLAILMRVAAPEYVMLILMGLVTIVVASRGNILKGVVAGGFGILLSLVGFSDTTGAVRFTGGITYLWDGFELVPATIGLFGVAEMLALAQRGGAISRATVALRGRWRNGIIGLKEIFRYKVTFLRSSVIGTIIGILPGLGGAVATVTAYVLAMQSSKHPEEFGKGAPEGIVASESSNNASDGGGLLPTVSFGIPGKPEMVVVMAALVMYGFAPGPAFVTKHLDLVFVLIWGITFANLVAAIMVIGMSKELSRLSAVNSLYIIPVVAVICLTAAYLYRNEPLDVVVSVLFGFLSYGMRRTGYSIVSFVIGFILGGIFENSFHQSLQISYGSYAIFFRPIAAVLFAVTMAMLLYTVLKMWRVRKEDETT